MANCDEINNIYVLKLGVSTMVAKKVEIMKVNATNVKEEDIWALFSVLGGSITFY